MITSGYHPTPDNRFLFTVCWMKGAVHQIETKVTDSPEAGQKWASCTMRKIILNRLTQYVNHREKVMAQYGGFCNMAKLKAVEKIRDLVNLCSARPLRVACTMVVANRDYIMELLPGTTSDTYDYWKNFTAQLFSFCEKNNSIHA